MVIENHVFCFFNIEATLVFYSVHCLLLVKEIIFCLGVLFLIKRAKRASQIYIICKEDWMEMFTSSVNIIHVNNEQ